MEKKEKQCLSEIWSFKVTTQFILISNSNNIDEARNSIQNNLDTIHKLVSNRTNDFEIKYGMNYFPKKVYKNVIYNCISHQE